MKHKKIDRSKLKIDESKLTNYSEILDEKYGKRGTKTREEMGRTKRHGEQIDNYVGKERFWEEEN